MSALNEDYIQCFMKHLDEGQRLFHIFHKAGNAGDIKTAIQIVSLAIKLLETSAELQALADIFAALDATGRTAVLPIMQNRLNVIADLTTHALLNEYRVDDSSESTTKAVQHLRTDADRFIE